MDTCTIEALEKNKDNIRTLKMSMNSKDDERLQHEKTQVEYRETMSWRKT